MSFVLLHGSGLTRRSDNPPKSIDIIFSRMEKSVAKEFATNWARSKGLSNIPIKLRESTSTIPEYPVCDLTKEPVATVLFDDSGQDKARPLVFSGLSTTIRKGCLSENLDALSSETPRVVNKEHNPDRALDNESSHYISVLKETYAKNPELVDKMFEKVAWGRLFKFICTDKQAMAKIKAIAGDSAIIHCEQLSNDVWSVVVSNEGDEQLYRIPLKTFEEKLGLTTVTTATTKEKRTIMANVQDTTQKMKQAMKNAAWKTWAKQVLKRSTELIAMGLTKGKNNDESTKTAIAEALKTDVGKMMVGLLLSTALEYAPLPEHAGKDRAIQELREVGMEMGMTWLTDLVLDPLFDTFKDMMSSMPADEDTGTQLSLKEAEPQKAKEQVQEKVVMRVPATVEA